MSRSSSLDEPADLKAEHGSPSWARGVARKIQFEVNALDSDVSLVQNWIQLAAENEVWRILGYVSLDTFLVAEANVSQSIIDSIRRAQRRVTRPAMSAVKESWDIVQALQDSLTDGKHGLSAVPKLITRIIAEEMWRSFWCAPLNRLAEHSSFESYVVDDLPTGLGVDIRTIKNICRDDAVALDAIDKATQNEPCKHAVDNVNGRPAGNSRDAALRRLRKDQPELHAKVLSGELSAHAAMVEAGYRKKLSHAEKCAAEFRKVENKTELLEQLRQIVEAAQ